MLDRGQIARLAVLGLALWGLATLYIRFLPSAVAAPVQGSIGYVTSLPMAWLSVGLIKAIGRLRREQLLGGVAVVGALAMMTDGAMLRWFAFVYGDDARTLHLGAAWLLWGYGLSLAIAFIWAQRPLAPR